MSRVVDRLSRLRRCRTQDTAEPAKPSYSPENLPPILSDARTYVAHGNNVWGNSISFDSRGEHELSVSGWLARAPFPRAGDKLMTLMASGKWGVYVFGEVRRCFDPNDMFTATAYGAVDYAEDEPQSKRCDEFIDNLPAFFR